MKTLKYLILACLFMPTSPLGCNIVIQPVPEYKQTTKVEYLRRYAPRVWFHSEESYWPSTVEWSFHFLKRSWWRKEWWLFTKQELDKPSSVLPYFHGADPKRQWTDVPLKLDEVPVYAFRHPVDKDTVDLLYFFYYPYNRGKEVVDTIFGNHVGDWEHVTVRLTLQRDSQGRETLAPSMNAVSFCLAYHDKDKSYVWGDVPKVQGTEHPIIYSAKDSHGSWLDPGDHEYKKFLTDLTDAGTNWDTWKKMECFDYDAKKGLGPTWKGTWPNWLKKDGGDKRIGNEDPASGPVTHWGNRKSKRGWFGHWRLTDGIVGPVDKPEFTTRELD